MSFVGVFHGLMTPALTEVDCERERASASAQSNSRCSSARREAGGSLPAYQVSGQFSVVPVGCFMAELDSTISWRHYNLGEIADRQIPSVSQAESACGGVHLPMTENVASRPSGSATNVTY